MQLLYISYCSLVPTDGEPEKGSRKNKSPSSLLSIVHSAKLTTGIGCGSSPCKSVNTVLPEAPPLPTAEGTVNL